MTLVWIDGQLILTRHFKEAPPTKIRSLKNCLDSPFATILAMSFRSATGDGLNYVAPLKSLDGHGAGSVGNGWATCHG